MLDAVTIVSLLALAAGSAAAGGGISVTPHASYSSSVGVLGCKINTNRVAYWPGSVDCTNICVKVTYEGRSVNLLRIDSSAGAHDISYDAWNYLQTGKSATEEPISGGGVAMTYEDVDASECADLIFASGLPLSAANSMDFVAGCLAEPSSWVAQNHVLYNIADPLCSVGYDETCTLDLAVSNQPSCPHILGSQEALTTKPVCNIEYPTGKTVNAVTGEQVSANVALAGTSDDGSSDSTAATAATMAASSAATTAAGSSGSNTDSTESATAPGSPPAAAADTTEATSGSSTTAVSSLAVDEAPAYSTTSCSEATAESESTTAVAATTTSTSATTTSTTATTTTTSCASTSSSASASPGVFVETSHSLTQTASSVVTVSTAVAVNTTASATPYATGWSSSTTTFSTAKVPSSSNTVATVSAASSSPSTVVTAGASSAVWSLRAVMTSAGLATFWLIAA